MSSLSRLATTQDMTGRASGSSCTDKSPIWMHRRASTREQPSTIDDSIRSIGSVSARPYPRRTSARNLETLARRGNQATPPVCRRRFEAESTMAAGEQHSAPKISSSNSSGRPVTPFWKGLWRASSDDHFFSSAVSTLL